MCIRDRTDSTRLPPGPKTRRSRAVRACRFVQLIARLSFDPSPFGEKDRAAMAAGLVPGLDCGPDGEPNVTPLIAAATVVLFGAGIGTRFAAPVPLAATQPSARTYRADCHDVIGPLTRYQV